jgi:hypothetical protein
LSQTVSQSSSRPLQVSAGGVHEAGHTHVALHTFVPLVPHTVLQIAVPPRQQP